MSELITGMLLLDGKTGINWSKREKPSINHWYRTKDLDLDYWKIKKDFYSPKTGITYYKIVEYYNGDVLYTGHSLAAIREIIRDNTFRMVV